MAAVNTVLRSKLRAWAMACLGAGAIGLTAVPPARADRPDHDRARAAVQQGQVLPLKTVLERVERAHPGQVLEVELEHEGGRWVYELKLLQPDGRLVKLQLDARSAELISRRERGGR